MEIEYVNPLEGTAWDELVAGHPDATIFHSSAWARVLSETYSHKPFYLQIRERDRRLGLMPIMEVSSRFTGTRGICLPFTDFCGPLVLNDFDPAELAHQIVNDGRGRNWSYLEVRAELQSQSAVPTEPFYLHDIDLGVGTDRLFDNLESSVRRAIRKAEKNHVQASVSDTWEAVLAYYKLHVGTRRRHGIPPQPLAFFRNIYDEIIRPGLGFVICAGNNVATFAAALFFGLNGKALYKFGASDERFQSMRGNNLVMWEAIRHLAASGFRTLSLGRTAQSDDNLRRFKAGWGAEERLVSYSRYAIMRPVDDGRRHRTQGFHNVLFRHLPLTINRMAGTILYPHLD